MLLLFFICYGLLFSLNLFSTTDSFFPSSTLFVTPRTTTKTVARMAIVIANPFIIVSLTGFLFSYCAQGLYVMLSFVDEQNALTGVEVIFILYLCMFVMLDV